jgi:hypothetical protein
MKAKKALKRLTKVETLLAGVIDQYPGSTGNVRELLDNAKASVGRAKKTVNVKASPKTAKKPPVKAASSKNAATAQARKKVSPSAKKQAAVA